MKISAKRGFRARFEQAIRDAVIDSGATSPSDTAAMASVLINALSSITLATHGVPLAESSSLSNAAIDGMQTWFADYYANRNRAEREPVNPHPSPAEGGAA